MNDPLPIQLNAEEYLRREARQATRSELHHGFVVAFAGGTLERNLLAPRMRDVLARIFPAPCMTFSSDVKIKISKDMFFYPDLSVACDPVDLRSVYLDRAKIVVEVLSKSTRGYDLIEKRAAYRSLPSLEAYAILHSDRRLVEVDARVGDAWQTARYGEFDSVLLGGVVMPVSEIYGPLVAA